MGLGIFILVIRCIALGMSLVIDLLTIPRQIRKKYKEAEWEILAKTKKMPVKIQPWWP
jgi:hypothetical protein